MPDVNVAMSFATNEIQCVMRSFPVPMAVPKKIAPGNALVASEFHNLSKALMNADRSVTSSPMSICIAPGVGSVEGLPPIRCIVNKFSECG